MSLQTRLNEEIDRLRPAITKFLQTLVRFQTLPGHEQEAQHFIAGKLRDLQCHVDILKSDYAELESHPAFSDDGVSFDDRLSVVGTWKGSGNGKSLILNGHMDVVPVGNLSLWQFPPWEGLVQEGRLHGRGACDMKAGLTAGIFAIQALQQIGFQPAGNVCFESVIGEESGGVGTLTTIMRGFTADAAVIMEPTRLRICPLHSGALSFRLRVSGRAIHASMKQFGVSAIDKFQRVFAALEELDASRHAHYSNPIFEFQHNIAPICVGTITAGDWPSTVPEELVAEGRFGVFPGESTADARNALVRCLDEVVAADEWLSSHPPVLEWFEGQFEPGETNLNEPILAALSEAHAGVLEERPAVQGVPYGSDLRLFTLYGKTPCALYGPGDVAFAHTVEEHVELDEVFACTKILARLIIDWCSRPHGEDLQPSP
jgi:acetylornithine deacetylase